MPSFRIVFSGLMCHAWLSENERAAVLVRDEKHRSLIWVREGAYLEGNFVEDEPQAGWRRFQIPPDALIRFKDLQTSSVSPLPYPEVPKVTDIVNGFTPVKEIARLERHASIAGYIVYRGGDFSVGCLYPDAATFEDDENYLCRAREIVLDTQSLSDPVEIIDTNNQKSMLVAATATVGFTHLDKVWGAGDYQRYSTIAEFDTIVKQLKKNPRQCHPGGCNLPYPAFHSATVECTSSQWP